MMVFRALGIYHWAPRRFAGIWRLSVDLISPMG